MSDLGPQGLGSVYQDNQQRWWNAYRVHWGDPTPTNHYLFGSEHPWPRTAETVQSTWAATTEFPCLRYEWDAAAAGALGGNWQIWSDDAEAAREVAQRMGGYLVIPTYCPR